MSLVLRQKGIYGLISALCAVCRQCTRDIAQSSFGGLTPRPPLRTRPIGSRRQSPVPAASWQPLTLTKEVRDQHNGANMQPGTYTGTGEAMKAVGQA